MDNVSETETATLDVSQVMDDEEPRPPGTPKKNYVPRSPRKLSQGNLMNICMQLIKVQSFSVVLISRYCFLTLCPQMADHPLLLRSFYDDEKLPQLAFLLKKHYPVWNP